MIFTGKYYAKKQVTRNPLKSDLLLRKSLPCHYLIISVLTIRFWVMIRFDSCLKKKNNIIRGARLSEESRISAQGGELFQ